MNYRYHFSIIVLVNKAIKIHKSYEVIEDQYIFI